MNTETAKTADINSQGIKIEATRQGVSELDFLGKFQHPEHPDSNDWAICIYRFPSGMRVAVTNGDPVWEETDLQLFAKLLEEYRIERKIMKKSVEQYIAENKLEGKKIADVLRNWNEGRQGLGEICQFYGYSIDKAMSHIIAIEENR